METDAELTSHKEVHDNQGDCEHCTYEATV